MTDGAAFSLLIDSREGEGTRVESLAKLAYYAVEGCAPEEMGIGLPSPYPRFSGLRGSRPTTSTS